MIDFECIFLQVQTQEGLIGLWYSLGEVRIAAAVHASRCLRVEMEKGSDQRVAAAPALLGLLTDWLMSNGMQGPRKGEVCRVEAKNIGVGMRVFGWGANTSQVSGRGALDLRYCCEQAEVSKSRRERERESPRRVGAGRLIGAEWRQCASWAKLFSLFAEQCWGAAGSSYCTVQYSTGRYWTVEAGEAPEMESAARQVWAHASSAGSGNLADAESAS